MPSPIGPRPAAATARAQLSRTLGTQMIGNDFDTERIARYWRFGVARLAESQVIYAA